MYLDSGSSSSWWYPERRSVLPKTVAPLRSETSSSSLVVGVTCVWRIALFASRMSTQSDFGRFFGISAEWLCVISILSDLRLLYDVFSFQSLEFFFHFVSEMEWNTAILPSYRGYRFVNVQFDTVVFELSCSCTETGVFVKVWVFRHQRRWSRHLVANFQYLQMFWQCLFSRVKKSEDWDPGRMRNSVETDGPSWNWTSATRHWITLRGGEL